MTKRDKYECFAVDEIEPFYSICQTRRFLDAAKKIPIPKHFKYEIVETIANGVNVHLVIANGNISFDSAIPICFLNQG